MITACQTPLDAISTQVKAEKQVEEEVQPRLNETICKVLGGPIRWSKLDTYDTAKQVEVLHNSQWVGYGCEGAKQ